MYTFIVVTFTPLTILNINSLLYILERYKSTNSKLVMTFLLLIYEKLFITDYYTTTTTTNYEMKEELYIRRQLSVCFGLLSKYITNVQLTQLHRTDRM